jgi:hypothetical protein
LINDLRTGEVHGNSLLAVIKTMMLLKKDYSRKSFEDNDLVVNEAPCLLKN